ncbi:outer membrane receptor protein involved in Fe transport [Rhodanobacter sp. ANJX3]|uniref:TonB-dependent receptor plug domain-containing protein n=1 Tax=Rhodanobacter sp. ANJX3 TaxID=2723083 RepID=UPI00160E2E20|nr:TonB-dependent receptor [Rhodanobacter sp. ANJX3]MBB5359771.1 outer membrane receptor protein involved in Fe transport [Rhodanobacter sp. ANJX3]
MKLGVTKLSSSVRLALSLGAVLAVGATSNAVFAQDTGSQPASTTQSPSDKKTSDLQTVVVTGSLIRRVDLETASPVVTIDRAQIQATGKATLGDLIQQLPTMTGGNVNPQTNNGGGTGASSINLRGLGSQRTLILVNGQRLLSGDPNAIPADAIERIDVLTVGASSVYGSDAIGGAVNFILRKDYQGATFTTNVGESDHDDGDTSGYTFTFGQSGDKGSIMAGVNYQKTDGIEAGARNFSKNALSLISTGHVIVGGSSSTPVGHIQIPGDNGDGTFAPGSLAAQFGCGTISLNSGGNATVPTAANYHCYGNADKYNYATVNLIETPQERTGAFLNGDYNLTDHVSAYMDATYQKTSSNFQLAPGVYGTDTSGATLDAHNAFNVFAPGTAYNASTGYGFRTRTTGLGNRYAFSGREDAQINTGLKGDFNIADNNWQWNVGVNYGHESVTTTTEGLINANDLYTGPSVLNADGTATCPTGISAVACQFNPFAINSPGSLAAEKAASAVATSNAYSQEKVWHADVNGELFSLPAGAVQLAVGAQYRTDHETVNPDTELLLNPNTGTCALGSQCVAGLSGGYNVKEVYSEAFIPVLADLPFVKSLNVDIGDRYSRFSSFGSTNNFKFQVEWKPFDDLLLRGTMADVFRAPTIGELYSSGSDAPYLTSDPCNGYTGQANLAAACQYVPTNGTFVNKSVTSATQISTITEGAAVAGFPIKPETGKSFDLGLVYSPSWAEGLSTTVDFWHIYLDNTISSIGAQAVLNLCAGGQTVYCQYIKRIASGPNAGQIGLGFIEPTGNLGSLATGGIDWSARYKLPQYSFGKFTVGVDATYLNYFNQQAGGTTYKDAGQLLAYGSSAQAACPTNAGICLFPRWRASGFVQWQLGNWEAEWRPRYIGTYSLQDSYGGVQGPLFHEGSTLYHDFSFGYNLEVINSRIDFGVNNAFDKQPPILYANNTLNANTDPSDFDLIGRYYWARFTVKF